MRRLIIALAVCLVLVQSAWAQDGDQMLSGFKLGKFYSVCSVLGMELFIIQNMCGDLDLSQCTQESLANEIVTQDQMDTAVILVTYAQIRTDTVIRSICEQGMDAETFDHPALAQFKGRIVPLISDLWRDTESFIDGGDPVALGEYIDALTAAGYIDRLLTLAEEAAIAAGDVDEAEEVSEAAEAAGTEG